MFPIPVSLPSPDKIEPDYIVVRFSPPIRLPRDSRRKIKPYMETRHLACTTVVIPPSTTDPVREAAAILQSRQFEGIELYYDYHFYRTSIPTSPDFSDSVALSKRVEFGSPLVEQGDLKEIPDELFMLFPNITELEILPPFLVVTVRPLPPKPWPFTVGGLVLLPTQISSSKLEILRGAHGEGQKVLERLDLSRGRDFSEKALKKAIEVFKSLRIRLVDIMWCPTSWSITVTEPMKDKLRLLPSEIGNVVCFYRFEPEVPEPPALTWDDTSPYDDTSYITTSNICLRPGVMLSSSQDVRSDGNIIESNHKLTTSGVLVADHEGQPLVTVGGYVFNGDSLVYHPNSLKGSVIGRIEKHLPTCGISLMKLDRGLRYANETFGSAQTPQGFTLDRFSSCRPPELHVYDRVTMDNPYSGACEGLVVGFGAIFDEDDKGRYILHHWLLFETGLRRLEGCCGSPVVDSNGKVIGLFQHKYSGSPLSVAVSAVELSKLGYRLCRSER
ncbi:hypothetical protein AJ79_04111 [Helicocarpus griseus UAMH5409]|uniref:Uncharacterized protein n=1 Tax=Helicocarpus griseus UAMH5409 TaxID=1447875 RepID=A0A2B7XUS4_9EURO|nr:hypothetical protein AJ79_04111 [Helicocarpus griseus UAMH5409]